MYLEVKMNNPVRRNVDGLYIFFARNGRQLRPRPLPFLHMHSGSILFIIVTVLNHFKKIINLRR